MKTPSTETKVFPEAVCTTVRDSAQDKRASRVTCTQAVSSYSASDYKEEGKKLQENLRNKKTPEIGTGVNRRESNA